MRFFSRLCGAFFSTGSRGEYGKGSGDCHLRSAFFCVGQTSSGAGRRNPCPMTRQTDTDAACERKGGGALGVASCRAKQCLQQRGRYRWHSLGWTTEAGNGAGRAWSPRVQPLPRSHTRRPPVTAKRQQDRVPSGTRSILWPGAAWSPFSARLRVQNPGDQKNGRRDCRFSRRFPGRIYLRGYQAIYAK